MRRAADSVFADDAWEEEDDETCVPDERPHRSRRCHLAEYFDTEDGVEGTLTAPRVT